MGALSSLSAGLSEVPWGTVVLDIFKVGAAIAGVFI